MRFRSAAAKRVQAHRGRARMGLRCLTVRVSDREARRLISDGYLALESSEAAAAVTIGRFPLILSASQRKAPTPRASC